MTESILNNPNIHKVEKGGKTFFLLGTAHISQESADTAEALIKEVQPDAVAIELCAARYENLRDPQRWRNTDIVKIIKEGKTFLLLSQLLLAAFQKRIAKNLDIRPGAEMLAAAMAADQNGSEIILADRDIKITLKRAWSELSLWTTLKLIFAMVKGAMSADSIDEKEIERLKQSDVLEELMKEFSEQFPTIRKSIIDERDLYLAGKIYNESGNSKTIVAVMGAGHIPGILKNLSEPIDFAALENIPAAKPFTKIIGWSIPALVVLLFLKIFTENGSEALAQMLSTWALATGGLSALGAALALAHPFSILAAFLAAPITTLHPMLAAGMVSGLVEALIRKPTVRDIETTTEDITSIKGIYRNRFLRILLVFNLTNLAAFIGAAIGVYELISYK